jgi:hypothetical protein
MKKITLMLVVLSFAAMLTVVYAGNSLGSGYALTSNWHGQNVPPGATVIVTASTTDSNVEQVTFLWKTPSGNTVFTDVDITRTTDGEYDGKTVYTFSSEHVLPAIQGDWGVQALFQGDGGKTKQGIEEVISIKATSFFAVPDLPMIGTLGSLVAMFLGLGLYTTRRRKK